jgi:ABC-type glycerol-3-phosphate transport system permease component
MSSILLEEKKETSQVTSPASLERKRTSFSTFCFRNPLQIRKFFPLLLLIIGSLAFLSPLYIMLVTALKTPEEVARSSHWAWPQNPTLENFVTVLKDPNVSFFLLFRNSVTIALLTTLGTVASSSLAAYAFARMRFRGRDRLFVLLLSTMMLPAIITTIPSYVMYKYLHWIDTFRPLILPAFFGNPFTIFMLRQFFSAIPKELEEAAMLDGASYWKLFTKVILPLSKPALSMAALLAFVSSWRDFMGPFIYLNDPAHQTLEVGLRTYQAFNSEQWHLLMAGSFLVMMPLILIFFVGQRYFIRGIVISVFR